MSLASLTWLRFRLSRTLRLHLTLFALFGAPLAQSQTLLPCGLPAEANIVSGDVSYTMSANCQLTGQISILNDAKVTVNGGGYTITGRDQNDLFFYASDNAALVINNATLDGKGVRRSQLVDVRGTLEMTKVSIRNASNGPPVYLTGTGELEDVLFENNDPSAYGKARSASALRLNGGRATVKKAVFRDNYGGGGAITVEVLNTLVGSLTTEGCLLFSGNVPYDVQVKTGASWTKSHSGTCTGTIGNGDQAVIAEPAMTACGMPARGNLDNSAVYSMTANCSLATTAAHDPYWDIHEGASIEIKGNGYTISGGSDSNNAYIRIADNATLDLENVALDRVWILSFGDFEATGVTFADAATRAIWVDGGAEIELSLFRGNTTGRSNQATALMASSYFGDGEATIKNTAFINNTGTHASNPSYVINTWHTSNLTTAKITLEGCISYSGNTPSDKNYLASANITDNSTGACPAGLHLGHVPAPDSDGDEADDDSSAGTQPYHVDGVEGCFQRLGMLAILCRYKIDEFTLLEVWKVHADSRGSLALWAHETQFAGLERERLLASTADGRVGIFLVNDDCVRRDEHFTNPRIASVDCVAAKLSGLRDGGEGKVIGRFKHVAVSKGPTFEGKAHTVYLDDSIAGTVIGTFDLYIGEPGRAVAAAEVAAEENAQTQPADPQPVAASRLAIRQARGQDGAQWHVVQPGDTLSGISAAYVVSMRRIMALNDLTDDDLILAGSALLIRPPP